MLLQGSLSLQHAVQSPHPSPGLQEPFAIPLAWKSLGYHKAELIKQPRQHRSAAMRLCVCLACSFLI